MWETNLVSFLPPTTSNLSPACNMSLTQYERWAARPRKTVWLNHFWDDDGDGSRCLLFIGLLTASKIGRMPAHLHGSWALRRSKNLKFYIPGHQNEGENAKAHAKISAIVNKNTVGLDGPLADAIPTRFGAICSLLRARRGFRMWGKMGGRKVKSKDFSGHNNQVERYNHGICKLRQNGWLFNGSLVVNERKCWRSPIAQRPPKAADEFLTVELFSF